MPSPRKSSSLWVAMGRSLLCILYSSFRTRSDANLLPIGQAQKNRDSPMCNCTSEVRVFGARPRNDDGRIAKAALRDWQDTIAASRLCNGGRPVTTPSRRSSPLLPPRDRPPASRAADSHSVVGAHRRPRDRPLAYAPLMAIARRAGLVVFRRGLHEHHQRSQLSTPSSKLIKRFGLSPRACAGNAGLCSSLALCALSGNFIVLSFARLLAGSGRGGRIRRRRRAGGTDRAIAARRARIFC